MFNSKTSEPPADVPAESATASGSDGQAGSHGQKRADETDDGDSHKRVKFADKGFSLLEKTFLLDDSDAGQQAPKIPKLDDGAYKQGLSQVTSHQHRP